MNCLPNNLHFRVLHLFGAALLAFVCTFSANRSLAADPEPQAVVEAFDNALLATMKDAATLGIQGRYDKLAGPIDTAFDLKRMIRVASSPQWRKASEEQQTKLLAAFRRLSVATYAEQFDSYSGQKFETTGQRPGPQQTVLVGTRIVDTDGSDTKLTYVMKKDATGWKIADVLLENSVSQLAVRRSEYRDILRNSGIDGLISTLNKKADTLLGK